MSCVLIVDDEKLVRLLLSRALKKEGISVVDAECGKEALEKIRDRQFDVVILDLRLGDINGIEVLRELNKTWPETKVMVITAYKSEDIQEEALNHGIIGLYEKPFDTFEIIERIKQSIKPHFSTWENLNRANILH